MNEEKGFFKSKTVWAGIATIISGIGTIVTTQDYATGATAIITGFGLIFSRTATKALK